MVKSKKVSAPGEDGCDKLQKAASNRWECCEYGKIDVIDILRSVDLKHFNCAGKEDKISQTLFFQVSWLHST